MSANKLTREELSMLGFDENGKSTLDRNNYNATAWENISRPRVAVRQHAPQRASVIHFDLNESYFQPVPQERLQELQQFVGRFVCVKGVYGLIDAVHNDRLGFVEGSSDEWSSHIVPKNQVRLCTEAEAEIARSSAEWYFLHECESLHRRLAICGERELETLRNLYEEAMSWYVKVKG